LVFLYEGLVALVPDHKDHRRERQRLFTGNWVVGAFHLPVLKERIFIGGTGRRPHIDSLVLTENGVGAFQRAHGNQVYLDVLSLRRLRKLLPRPFQPALLLSSISNANFSVGRAAEDAASGTAAAQLRQLGLAGEEIISSGNACGDKQEHHNFTQAS